MIFFLIILAIIIFFVHGNKNEAKIVPENHSFISQVLDRLTNDSIYDKRLRPNYGEGPVQSIRIFVCGFCKEMSFGSCKSYEYYLIGLVGSKNQQKCHFLTIPCISSVSEVTMDFTLDFYLRQNWLDPRLDFRNLDSKIDFKQIGSLTVGVDYLNLLWKPDTFFPNEKSAFFHTATTHNSFLRIDPDGRVFTSQRLTVTATCPMDLQYFPMDTQTCRLEIESYGYSSKDIDYFWGVKQTDKEEEAVKFGNYTLPQFSQDGYRVNSTHAITSTGTYPRLYFDVILIRNLGFYLMNIILPSMALLTMTNNVMPKVSYIKSIDVFLNFCFGMVFASLVEFAFVSYLRKKDKERKKKQKNRDENPKEPDIQLFMSNLPNSSNQNFYYKPPELAPNCNYSTFPFMQSASLSSFHKCLHPIPLTKPRKLIKLKHRITSAKIDKCSRCFFPTLFRSIYRPTEFPDKKRPRRDA